MNTVAMKKTSSSSILAVILCKGIVSLKIHVQDNSEKLLL